MRVGLNRKWNAISRTCCDAGSSHRRTPPGSTTFSARDTSRAETLVRQHALGLADHVAKNADYLD